ncbi:unnamed protein product [Anisakis simplex]|uniref:40S ribosomal protein S15 n=1 Tax=Anisakis simplex TaxID=6269 RepID=A0A0M3JGH4_ANISI|nr:unnamed protein product [Anisakis simplex]
MASAQDEAAIAELKKKRTFRKFSYRGVDLDQLLDMNRSAIRVSSLFFLGFYQCSDENRTRNWRNS